MVSASPNCPQNSLHGSKIVRANSKSAHDKNRTAYFWTKIVPSSAEVPSSGSGNGETRRRIVRVRLAVLPCAGEAARPWREGALLLPGGPYGWLPPPRQERAGRPRSQEGNI